jgi:hypothetical protein
MDVRVDDLVAVKCVDGVDYVNPDTGIDTLNSFQYCLCTYLKKFFQ